MSVTVACLRMYTPTETHTIGIHCNTSGLKPELVVVVNNGGPKYVMVFLWLLDAVIVAAACGPMDAWTKKEARRRHRKAMASVGEVQPPAQFSGRSVTIQRHNSVAKICEQRICGGLRCVRDRAEQQGAPTAQRSKSWPLGDAAA